MTLAISKAVEDRREGGDLRVDGQHVGRRARTPPRAGLGASSSSRTARSRSASSRRPSSTAPRSYRSAATSTTALGLARRSRTTSRRPGQLGQPVPHRRARRPRRSRSSTRSATRRTSTAAGRQRGQHHRVLEGLPRVRRGRQRPEDPEDVRLPGLRRGAHRQRRGSPGTRHDRDRDPDRQPGELGGPPPRATSPAAWIHRDRPGRSSPPTGAGSKAARSASSSNSPSRRACSPLLQRRRARRRPKAAGSSARSPGTASRTPSGRSPPPRYRSPSRSSGVRRPRTRAVTRPAATRPETSALTDGVAAARRNVTSGASTCRN